MRRSRFCGKLRLTRQQSSTSLCWVKRWLYLITASSGVSHAIVATAACNPGPLPCAAEECSSHERLRQHRCEGHAGQSLRLRAGPPGFCHWLFAKEGGSIAWWIERRPLGVPVRAAARKGAGGAGLRDGPARAPVELCAVRLRELGQRRRRSGGALRVRGVRRRRGGVHGRPLDGLADLRALRETRQSREETERVPPGRRERPRDGLGAGGRAAVAHINKGAVAGRHGQGRRVPAARVPLVCCPASRHRRDSRVTYAGRP